MTGDQILESVVRSILSEAQLSPPAKSYDRETWARLTEAGLHAVGIPESSGGSGGDLEDLGIVARAVGYAGARLPLIDNWMAEWVLASLGSPMPGTPKGFALARSTGPRNVHLSAIDWFDSILVVEEVDEGKGVALWFPDGTAAAIEVGVDSSGLVVSTMDLEAGSAVGVIDSFRDLEVLVAFLGAMRASGGVKRLADLTRTYAWQRHQFGRPIARFQAVQALVVETHELALLTEVALDEIATRFASEGWRQAEELVAAGIVLAAECAAQATTASHQVHGAIGFTAEHPLSWITRQLHAWRDEDRSDLRWSEWLGRHTREIGGAGLWDLMAVDPPKAAEPVAENSISGGS